MLRAVVAPNAFKTVASAVAVARGWADRLADLGWAADACPLADGGDGSLDVVRLHAGGAIEHEAVAGPLGAPVDARWLRLGDDSAFIESAEAYGMRRLAEGTVGAASATSRGVGELVLAALACPRIVVGIGGSASTDGGIGAVQALDAAGALGVARRREIVLACDVRNPLLGRAGAARTYGPQKGLDPAAVDAAERRLSDWARQWPDGPGLARQPHAGAGGGLAFGLHVGVGADLGSGFDAIAELVGLDARLADADLALTGEGHLDRTSLAGKATGEFLDRAVRAGVPRRVLITGSADAVVADELRARDVVVIELVGTVVRSQRDAVDGGLRVLVEALDHLPDARFGRDQPD